METLHKVEVCFSPALYSYFENPGAITVVVDILRASSAICTAFMSGVEKIIPVGTLEEAEAFKADGFMVAAERDGIVRDFADFGNSPFNFTPEKVKGKSIVYSTTNGTQAIQLASSSSEVIVGSFLNLSSVVSHLINAQRDVLLLCAGWKSKFNLEDTLFAGAVVDRLLDHGDYMTICDSSLAAQDLWTLARNDLVGYIEKAAQRHRLKINNLDDVIEYCHTIDLTDVIPVLENNYLIRLPAEGKLL